MNCPTRDPEPAGKLGHNQNPDHFNNDLTTNSSENQSCSSKRGRESESLNSPLDLKIKDNPGLSEEDEEGESTADEDFTKQNSIPLKRRSSLHSVKRTATTSSGLRFDEEDMARQEDDDSRTPLVADRELRSRLSRRSGAPLQNKGWSEKTADGWKSVVFAVKKYAKFFGPGIMVSVAYMDPGNYSTAVSAGALYQYKLLFVVLVSNLFAVFLQTLCCKLGSVTGMDLAQNCREHLPRWLCIGIYILAEIAIIATDLAEVVGTAIALNILFGIPLSVGVGLTIIDVLLVLMAYRPNGPMKIVRYFEYAVALLVAVVVICFAIELSKIGPVDKGQIFEGFFVPHKELFESTGLYLSCGILGATVMPHSLYLGSGLVQPRLREYDTKHGYCEQQEETGDIIKYRPSIHAIRYAMGYSIAELIVSLFTVAIFVNAAILIVAGATLSNSPSDAVDADLFSIYDMLIKYLGQAAGIIFALALLFSGQSAGIVCTLSGQMVSEGFLHWSFQPWVRRLITRGLAIAPCFAVAMFVGRKGLADVLNASQVVLSLMLPFVSAPLLYFTAHKKIMRVPTIAERVDSFVIDEEDDDASLNSYHSDDRYSPLSNDNSLASTEEETFALPEYIDMSNGLFTNIVAVAIFALVSALNLFLIVSMAMGEDVHL